MTPAGNAIADGFDKLAAYGKVGSSFRWLIDTDNDGVPDPLTGFVEPMGTTGMPVAGNFDGNKANGDEVGLLGGQQVVLRHQPRLQAGQDRSRCR